MFVINERLAHKLRSRFKPIIILGKSFLKTSPRKEIPFTEREPNLKLENILYRKGHPYNFKDTQQKTLPINMY